MTNDLLRYMLAGFLVLHGIGHVGGPWFFVRSWLSPHMAESPLKWIFVAIWLTAMVAFIIGGVMVLQHQETWRTIALVASVVSLVVSLFFIQSPAFNAAAADIIILAGLLVFQWPSVQMVGS